MPLTNRPDSWINRVRSGSPGKADHGAAGETSMKRRFVPRLAGGVVVVLVAATGALASRAIGQGVTVALTPVSSSVAPGSQFDLFIEVTRQGSLFNAFDAIVGYDPAALTSIPLSPLSLQEGSYMKAACSTRFHRFRQGTDRDTTTDVLLCNGVAVAGPGQIYRLHFKASNTTQVTRVRFLPGLQFYNNGLYVNPAYSSDATIGIGTL